MSKSTYVEIYQNVDYIYCLSCIFHDSVGTNFQPLEFNDTTIACNLEQRQRSSQQILDLADYLNMHSDTYKPMRRWGSPESFSSDIPLWIELANTRTFFLYFKDKFEGKDVMLIHDVLSNDSNLNDIEKFCKEQKWRITSTGNVAGSEAAATILYDMNYFVYEDWTRAKTQLIIVTIDVKWGYVLSLISKLFCFLKWSIFLCIDSSFTIYKILRKENMIIKIVQNIPRGTKARLAKTYIIVNS